MTTSQGASFHLLLDVYGVTVGIDSTDARLVDHLGEDFLYFRTPYTPSAPKLKLFMHLQAPPYDEVPQRPATVYTPRNVSFHDNDRTYIDYSGRALAILAVSQGQLDVFSLDADLLYEVGYLFLLSQLGEHLDRSHLHRVHALGISLANRSALVLLPMGGGKSTLVTHLLAHPQASFLSDDSPLIDPSGTLHAFPLRIGILPGSEIAYQPHQLRTIQRMEFGPKLLLRHEYFAHRIVSSASPAFIFLGKRSLSSKCVILPASKFATLRALIPNCVIGLGLFQGMEFVFNRDPGEIWKKAGIALSRLRNCIALTRRSSTHTIILGRDLEDNAATLLAFMERGR